MCSIAGAICKNGEDAIENVYNMLKVTQHRGPDGAGITDGRETIKGRNLSELDHGTLKGKRALGHLRLKITGEAGIQPLFDCSNNIALVFNGEIWNYKSLKKSLNNHEFKTDSDGEVIVHLVEEFYHGSLADAVSKAMELLDGDYAFAVMDSSTIVLARDPVGIKPLYYSLNGGLIAFSSERKALWNQGLEPKRVMPGNIVSINGQVVQDAVKELEMPRVKLEEEEEALRLYGEAIKRAVQKRIDGHQRIGVIFSGGVDSTLIAKLAQDLWTDVTCYTAGLPDSDDVIAAKNAAESMGMKIKVNELSKEKILGYLPEILEAIEDWNQLQVEVSIPIFASVKEAKKDGQRVLLTGQGADELFAGYDWYPRVLREEGEAGLETSLWNDIKNLYKETLEREDKITMYNSIELRVPFLDPEVIEASMSTPIRFKTESEDEMRKHLHRKFAERIGVPSDFAWRKKDAAQHGSNVHRTIDELLKELGFAALNQEYTPKNENLGSVYRYKGAYGNLQTQLFLDAVAYFNDLMRPEAKERFEEIMAGDMAKVEKLMASFSN